MLVTIQSEEGSVGAPDLGENIDATTFEQILEMDDDEEEREFSKSIVYDFFSQAEQTFQKMDSNLCVNPTAQPISPENHSWSLET